jgi:hypothetical protein
MRPPALGTLLCACLFAAAAGRGDDGSGRADIREADLLRHLNFLASDTLEGRDAGSSGGRAAAVYLVGELQRLGLKPAGEEGRFTQDFGVGYANLLALLPGADENLQGEYLVVCAHYDHVGYGRRGNAFGPIGYIHNGADDNASGTAAVLEIAETLALANEKPRRSILFAWWDAEEINLNGSEHWRTNPTLPLPGAELAINVDMVGRLTDNGLIVHGARTAAGLRTLVSLANSETDLLLDYDRRHVRDSDHYPFFQGRIPYLFFDTGKHADYHRPTDDVERLNLPGLARVTRLICSVVRAAAAQDRLTEFRPDCIAESRQAEPEAAGRPLSSPVRLGVTWYPRRVGEPVRVRSVDPGTPAARAGLRGGDILLQFNGHNAATLEHLATWIAMSASPALLKVSRDRNSEPLVITADLAGPPVHGGCLTRHDPAEPSAQIVTRVLRGSPADRAGLAVGDRVLAAPWMERGENSPATVPDELLIERRGRILRLALPRAEAGEETGPSDQTVSGL